MCMYSCVGDPHFKHLKIGNIITSHSGATSGVIRRCISAKSHIKNGQTKERRNRREQAELKPKTRMSGN